MGRLWTAQVALSWVTVPSALAVVQWSNNTGTTEWWYSPFSWMNTLDGPSESNAFTLHSSMYQ